MARWRPSIPPQRAPDALRVHPPRDPLETRESGTLGTLSVAGRERRRDALPRRGD
jgi:hypothetical protein